MVSLLLAHAADVCMVDERGDIALHNAAGNCNLAVMELLLALGSPLEAQNELDFTPLITAASNRAVWKTGDRALAAVALLLQEKANPNKADRAGYTSLHHAAYDGFKQVAALLLDAGADPEVVVSGKGGPEDIQGHSLLSYPPLRSIQNRFLVYAERDLETVSRILHKSSDAEHRAVSASVLGYVPDKAAITDDLIEATLDSDAMACNNATRSLGVIAAYAIDKPDLKIKNRAEPFIELLNSGIWSDLNKSSSMLSTLTRSRNPKIPKNLQEQALLPLVDMCRWRGKLVGPSARRYVSLL